jgi:hypothetical protein
MAAWVILIGLYIAAVAVMWVASRRGRLAAAWHRDLLALGLLALATLGFFWRVVSGQNWMPADGGDLVSFLYPTYRFAAASLRDAAWPLWNPHLYGGAPFVGDIQAGFLYPPNLLLFLLWPDFPYSALQGLSIGHIWFAGAGMYLFLAHGHRLCRLASLAGGLAFMFSDVFVTHFGNLNFNAVASWLPWIFWAFTAAMEARADGDSPLAVRPLGRAALAGLLLGIATLAGHIQATLFIVLALAAYAGLLLWLGREDEGQRPRIVATTVALALYFVVAGLIAAPVLLSSFQLAGQTARTAWNYTEAAGYSLAPSQLIGWFVPGFFGRGPQFHWGAWPRVEIGYLGILPLILAGFAIALRRERRTWAFAGLAVGSFILALGIYAIPHGWLTVLPGFGQLRAPARFVLLTDFALAALAAFGLEALLAAWDDRGRLTVERGWRLLGVVTAAAWLVAVPLAYLGLLLMQDRDPAIVLRISITLIAIVSFAGLLGASWLWLTAVRGGWGRSQTLGWIAVGLIFLDVASLAAYQDLGDRNPSLGFEQPAIAAFLAAQPGPFRIDSRTQIEGLWQPDTAALYGLEDVTGVANPLVLADFERYWGSLGSRSTRLYDLLNVRYVIAKKDVELDWNKFSLVFDGDPNLNVYENKQALPRAIVVPDVTTVGSHEAALQAITAAGFDPTATAIFEGDSAPRGGGSGAVSDIGTGGNGLSFTADVDAPSLVVVSQVWYPGWRVYIDGQPAGAPLRVNYLFQGVPVEAGQHRVELRFAPILWPAGWGLALLGLLVVIVLSALGWRERRAARTQAQVASRALEVT